MLEPSLSLSTIEKEDEDLIFTCSSNGCNVEFEPALIDLSKNKVTLSDGLAYVKAALFECPTCRAHYTAKVLSVLGQNGVTKDLLFLDKPTLTSEGMVVVAA